MVYQEENRIGLQYKMLRFYNSTIMKILPKVMLLVGGVFCLIEDKNISLTIGNFFFVSTSLLAAL